MKDKATRKSLRLKNFDYASNGKYFITICTFGKEYYFGKIENGKMKLSAVGQIVNEELLVSKQKWIKKNIEIEKYVVMPNHVHMIVSISKPELYHNYQKEEFGKPTSESISSIVRSFKSAVTREAHNKFSYLNTPYKIWQPRYYDNIIRSEDAYWKICEYIDKNPECWNEDNFNFVNIK